MSAKTAEKFRWTVALSFAVACGTAQPAPLTTNFGLAYSVTQSLWQGGPTAGLDESNRFGGSAAGAYYDIDANTGTVQSSVTGTLRTDYPDVVAAGTAASIDFRFLAGGGSIQSSFGASAEAGMYLNICIVDTPFGCAIGVDQDLPVIDEGFFLSPAANFTPTLDVPRSANDADQAAGRALFSFGPYSLGPSMNLDLDQTIRFTPTGLNGAVSCRNLDTGEVTASGLAIPTGAPTSVTTGALSEGTWECTVLDLALANTFRNDIDLEVRPAIDYIVGSWPPPGQELFGFGLLDETFALGFNTIASVGSFRITALAFVPEPASLALLALALGGLAVVRFRARHGVVAKPFRAARRGR